MSAPAPSATSSWFRRRPGWPGRAAAAVAFHAACSAAMVHLAWWAEARPAPSLPDAVLAHLPYLPWVDRYNYVLWLVAWVPAAALLLAADLERWCRFVVTGGWVSLLRGLCIAATGLGPVRPEAVSPLGSDGSPLYLTKDCFFSGHTATTLLVLLYVWRYPRLRAAVLPLHLLVVASVFLARLHYTIDVIGAYAVVLAVYFLREGDLARALGTRR